MTEPALGRRRWQRPVDDADHLQARWQPLVINGRKAFITGADGAGVGIVMAKADEGACMFLVDLPNPAIRIEHVPNTIDSSMPAWATPPW